MNRQKLFETILRVTGFTPLESDMDEIQNAVESDAVNAYDFAHWLLCNYDTSEEGMALCWNNAETKTKHDTLELLHQFKQLKK